MSGNLKSLVGRHFLLNQKEKLNFNLHGGQINAIIKHFIDMCVSSIAKTTFLYRRELALILELVVRDNRRHVSPIVGQELYDTLFSSVVVKSNIQHSKLVCNLNLERVFHHDVIDDFLHQLDGIEYIEKNSVLGSEEDKILFYNMVNSVNGDHTYISQAYLHVREAYSLYLKFKGYLIQKYTRYTFLEAVKASKMMSGMVVDIEDMNSNFQIFLSKAIDKYDSSRGTPTSYIAKWFVQAKTNPMFAHEYGVAYTVPIEERKRQTTNRYSGASNAGNYSVEITEDHLEIPDVRGDEEDNSRDFSPVNSRIALEAPNARYAFLHYNLPILFTPYELDLLSNTLKDNSKVNHIDSTLSTNEDKYSNG